MNGTNGSMFHFAPSTALSSSEDSVLANSIAIIGIGCRYPGALRDVGTLGQFWELLIKGQSAIHPVPSDRWTKEHGSNVGGFLSQIDTFDGRLFGISRKEIEYLDPQLRLLLEV